MRMLYFVVSLGVLACATVGVLMYFLGKQQFR